MRMAAKAGSAVILTLASAPAWSQTASPEAEAKFGKPITLTVGYGDLLVFDADGPVGNSLRWPDECVRHKVLDLVGDLALVGRPLHAHVRARRSGHRLNGAMAAWLAAGQGRRASA